MDSSPPTTPDSDAPARRERLHTVSAQLAAVDELIGLARRTIQVFDIDLSQMGWTRAARAEALAAFLRGSQHARLDVIVHDTRYLEGECARLIALQQRFGDKVNFCKTGREASGARDPLVIVDARHFLHRFDFEQPRATLGVDDPRGVAPLVHRFDEIWSTRESSLPGTLLGF
jgi:hypothetical protein